MSPKIGRNKRLPNELLHEAMLCLRGEWLLRERDPVAPLFDWIQRSQRIKFQTGKFRTVLEALDYFSAKGVLNVTGSANGQAVDFKALVQTEIAELRSSGDGLLNADKERPLNEKVLPLAMKWGNHLHNNVVVKRTGLHLYQHQHSDECEYNVSVNLQAKQQDWATMRCIFELSAKCTFTRQHKASRPLQIRSFDDVEVLTKGGAQFRPMPTELDASRQKLVFRFEQGRGAKATKMFPSKEAKEEADKELFANVAHYKNVPAFLKLRFNVTFERSAGGDKVFVPLSTVFWPVVDQKSVHSSTPKHTGGKPKPGTSSGSTPRGTD